MKKGQVYEGSVVRVDFPNKGIVCVGEETAVVKNSLPGQKVKFSVNKVRKGKAEGRLLEVTEKSPLETGRTCSLFGLCGGCTYLSLPYEEQLRLKEQQVKYFGQIKEVAKIYFVPLNVNKNIILAKIIQAGLKTERK